MTIALTPAPKLIYPKNPISVYKRTTTIIAVFKTPGQPRNCCGFRIEFSIGITVPIPSIAKITVLKTVVNIPFSSIYSRNSERFFVLIEKLKKKFRIKLLKEERKWVPASKKWFVMGNQWKTEHIVKCDSKHDNNAHIGHCRKRYQVFQLSDFSKNYAWQKGHRDVQPNIPIDLQFSVYYFTKWCCNQHYKQAYHAKIRGTHAIFTEYPNFGKRNGN